MLEAHAPHEPIHTWKGFFIHIATIAVGLLIAIGLEQTVEIFRHRDEVAMTREALHQERERDRANLALRAMEVRREHASLDNNLLVLAYLKEHPGTSSAQLPGILTWHSKRPELTTAAWSTAQQTFVTGLMPAGEVREFAKFYSHIALVAESYESYWRTLNDARLYAFRDPDPSHLSASQVDQIIEATQRALRALFLQEVTLINLNDDYPGFVANISEADVDSITHVAETERNPALTGPRDQTIQRIDAAGRQQDYFPQATAPSK